MIIISDYKDYYDGIAGKYRDTSIVFRRNTVDLTIKEQEIFDELKIQHGFNGYRDYDGKYFSLNLFKIGFCGKVFPGISLIEKTSPSYTCSYWYNDKKLDAYLYNRYTFKTSVLDNTYYSKELTRRHFLLQNPEVSSFKNKCIIHKKVLLYYGRHDYDLRWMENPVLRLVDFYKVYNPFQAYQEIMMFLGNLAQPDRPMITVSNDVKIHKHGFDKWSFRRPPKGK